MRSHHARVRWVPARLVATLLGLAVVGIPMAAVAQEPSPSSSPEALETVSTEPAELGGAWRRTAAGPFGAVDVPGGWTGTELVIVDPEQKRRAAAYYPALDSWRAVARPPRKVQSGSTAHWTGTELLFVEPRGTHKRGLTAYDPVADQWRSSAPSPMNEIAASVWAGDVLVIASATGHEAATYDPATDSWTELPPLPLAAALPGSSIDRPLSLHWTGERVYALVQVAADGELPPPAAEIEAESATASEMATSLAFVALDPADSEWDAPSTGPLSGMASAPLWTEGSFAFRTSPHGGEDVDAAPALNGRYDPGEDAWTVDENICDVDTSDAVWADPLVLSVGQGRAYDPASQQCYTLPIPPWPDRSSALQVWTGEEAIELSGITEDGKSARRDGLAYGPFPQDDMLGVAIDKPSRPVRVRVPSLGIDLPVISDERRVKGSSPGYPACDVALSWSPFDLPGEPGTAWILAHAQAGMFLPLLEAVRDEGKGSLLGRRIEVQLRDGRLFTYRTYRVNPRATNVNIGTKRLKKGEHRLVLQTSTGVGSAPKLLVAARLVDVGRTDEPRPKPKPRACG